MIVRFFKPQSTEKGNQFYSEVIKGRYDHYIWGRGKRFNPIRLAKSSSIKEFFTVRVSPYISPDYKVLDIGCGNGVFLPILAPMCRQLAGLDISCDMLKESVNVLSQFECTNVSVINSRAEEMPFAENEFDVIVLVDMIHHVTEAQAVIAEIKRIIKPEGKILVFEPNKLNPLLWLLCLLDRNEWGALSLGSKKTYQKLFHPHFTIIFIEYNGLLIGPDNVIYRKVVDFINAPFSKKFFSWLSPKLFFVLRLK